MSKIKMRCISCGKWFQSANAKEVTCPDCVQKARKEKMVSKTAPPNTPAGQGAKAAPRPVAPPPKPRSTQGGTNQWLDSLDDVKIGEPDQPPARPKFPPSSAPRDTRSPFSGRIPTEPGAPGNTRDERGESGERGDRERDPGNYRDERGERGAAGYGNYRDGGSRGPGGYRDGGNRGPGNYQVGGGSGIPGSFGQRPRQPMEGGFGQRPRPVGPGGENRFDRPRTGPGAPTGPGSPGGPRNARPAGAPRPKGKGTPRPASPPKPRREKIPPPQPFTPTTEQIAQVETRYLELATPGEFDGIRTQISKELTIPKKAVKKIIKDLRDRQDIPSWWELQVYKGSVEELASIKKAYEPYLPLPPVGVHKNISETLSLKPSTVYQAIKTIRQELNLPQYNDPTLHGIELKPASPQDAEAPESPSAEAASTDATPTEAPVDASPVAQEPATPPDDAAPQETSSAPQETTPVPAGVAAQQEQETPPVTQEESTPLEA